MFVIIKNAKQENISKYFFLTKTTIERVVVADINRKKKGKWRAIDAYAIFFARFSAALFLLSSRPLRRRRRRRRCARARAVRNQRNAEAALFSARARSFDGCDRCRVCREQFSACLRRSIGSRVLTHRQSLRFCWCALRQIQDCAFLWPHFALLQCKLRVRTKACSDKIRPRRSRRQFLAAS